MELSKEEELILTTLSFYEPLRWEQIILDLDESFLKVNPNFSKEDLEGVLITLEKKKLIKKQGKKDPLWLRKFPKKRLHTRLYQWAVKNIPFLK